MSLEELRRILRRIDGRGYRAYRDIEGVYLTSTVQLVIDHVQADPFAAPSKIRVRLPDEVAHLPLDLKTSKLRRLAFCDFLARVVFTEINNIIGRELASRQGEIVYIDKGGQEVLERTAVVIAPDWVEMRLDVHLPARGRSVLGRQAEHLLCDQLPLLAEKALCWAKLPQPEAIAFVECIENQEHLRSQLKEHGLVAFIADGAILPRASGDSNLPLQRGSVPFLSPESMRVVLPLLNKLANGDSEVSGMGIPTGLTLIVGGGYHGKSTLLRAIERGVYPHVPGDGREYVITDSQAVKIRAEDGRAVSGVNITPFINNLPQGRSTLSFDSDDASGSTSQATNIIEALEMGATTLLLDEDTSATNFMVRDSRMQALVHKEYEPITPFIDRVRELRTSLGVSTILVVGGLGDYFEVADTVVMMKEFIPLEVTLEAYRISKEVSTKRLREVESNAKFDRCRLVDMQSLDFSRGRRDVRVDPKGCRILMVGQSIIDLQAVEQLIDISQTRAIGYALWRLYQRAGSDPVELAQSLAWLENWLDTEGLDQLAPHHRSGSHPGNFARPRRFEIAAALNRYRELRAWTDDC